jgi:hypothetical protein
MRRNTANEIASIFGNQPLASAIHRSISAGLRSSSIHLGHGNTVWQIFKQSLDAAIRDIDNHPRGKLFRRLIEYGPHNPDEPQSLTSDGETVLSDPECSSCVEFIHSHMVNRFKGEIAELLALEPCVKLAQRLYKEGRLPSGVNLYFGYTVRQRARTPIPNNKGKKGAVGFTKGADGLFVHENKQSNTIDIHSVIEVKSMALPNKRITNQINRHIQRLQGGIRLEEREWSREKIWVPFFGGSRKIDSKLIRIIVVPSTEKLSREWHSIEKGQRREIVFPEPSDPAIQTRIEHIERNLLKITLPWSQEALEQAAYEMTFWYMSQVGLRVYASKELPRGWEHMTPQEAGHNSIKMMLYLINLRPISKRATRIATKLYNIYSFGYPLGVKSKELLWPEDFSEEGAKSK